MRISAQLLTGHYCIFMCRLCLGALRFPTFRGALSGKSSEFIPFCERTDPECAIRGLSRQRCRIRSRLSRVDWSSRGAWRSCLMVCSSWPGQFAL